MGKNAKGLDWPNQPSPLSTALARCATSANQRRNNVTQDSHAGGLRYGVEDYVVDTVRVEPVAI